MTSSMVSLSNATVPPEHLPGIRIMGFECCHCNQVTLDNLLGKCYDEQCSHGFCLGCTVIDRAGRLWNKQLKVPISWLCQCGSVHPVGETLVANETGKLTKPVCSCKEPSFIAMYNTYGRLCKDLQLSISLPSALNTAEAVQTLISELEKTSYGPCIRLNREEKNASTKEDGEPKTNHE